MKKIIVILFLAIMAAACSSETPVPSQPDFITVSLDDPFSVSLGETFELSVPEVQGALSYMWNLPEVLNVVGDSTARKITVAGVVEGTISGGMISVSAINASGASYSRTLWKDIRITGLPAKPGYVTISVDGSLAVDKDEEFQFFAQEDDAVTTREWTVPDGMEIVSGQGTAEVTVKATIGSVVIPKGSVKIATTTDTGLKQEYSFSWPIVVLPMEGGYGAKRYGTKVWMTENLNYAGEDGTLGKTGPDDDSGEKFGRYYSWEEAMTGSSTADCPYVYSAEGKDDMGNSYILNNGVDSYDIQVRGACPEGWHVPNAHDFYDLIAGIASDYNLEKSSLEAVRDEKQGVYLPANRETNPMAAANLIAYGLIASYVRGSRPAAEGGLWLDHNSLKENGTIFHLSSASGIFPAASDWPMYFPPLNGQIAFNIIPGGQYNDSGNHSGYGKYSFHWTATVNDKKKHFRFTLGNNTCNFSTYAETGTANNLRCVANYDPAHVPEYK